MFRSRPRYDDQRHQWQRIVTSRDLSKVDNKFILSDHSLVRYIIILCTVSYVRIYWELCLKQFRLFFFTIIWYWLKLLEVYGYTSFIGTDNSGIIMRNKIVLITKKLTKNFVFSRLFQTLNNKKIYFGN